jgi:hypothetical protein
MAIPIYTVHTSQAILTKPTVETYEITDLTLYPQMILYAN